MKVTLNVHHLGDQCTAGHNKGHTIHPTEYFFRDAKHLVTTLEKWHKQQRGGFACWVYEVTDIKPDMPKEGERFHQ